MRLFGDPIARGTSAALSRCEEESSFPIYSYSDGHHRPLGLQLETAKGNAADHGALGEEEEYDGRDSQDQ
jgi:hypothetical protein